MKNLYNNIEFDSKEQIQFYKWLQQCKQYKLINSWEYHPQSMLLSEPYQCNNKKVLREHKYTPDFIFQINDKYKNNPLFHYFKYHKNNKVYVDVKGSFNRYHSITQFSINQKWIAQKYDIYIYKIQIDKLFKNTFVPHECRFTEKTYKPRTKYNKYKTIQQYIQSN